MEQLDGHVLHPIVTTNTLTGTNAADILNAPGSVSTEVQGLQGNDTITAVLTSDVVQAGQGNDTVNINVTGAANVTAFGGKGKDSITLSTAVTTSVVFRAVQYDVLNFAGRTVSNATVGGNQGNDVITVSANTTPPT